jgi:hypothetical protein
MINNVDSKKRNTGLKFKMMRIMEDENWLFTKKIFLDIILK